MNCNTCIIGITLIFSSILMTIFKQDKDVFIQFSNLLDHEQKLIYRKIILQRITAYVLGIVIGLGLGFYYYFSNPKQPYPLCTFLSIVYLTKLAVYYLYPKHPLMLYSLKTKEQTDAWAEIYEEMKYRYKLSLLIGLLGYLLIFNGVNTK